MNFVKVVYLGHFKVPPLSLDDSTFIFKHECYHKNCPNLPLLPILHQNSTCDQENIHLLVRWQKTRCMIRCIAKTERIWWGWYIRTQPVQLSFYTPLPRALRSTMFLSGWICPWCHQETNGILQRLSILDSHYFAFFLHVKNFHHLNTLCFSEAMRVEVNCCFHETIKMTVIWLKKEKDEWETHIHRCSLSS